MTKKLKKLSEEVFFWNSNFFSSLWSSGEKVDIPPQIVYKWNRGYEIVWESRKQKKSSSNIFDITSRGRRSENRTRRAASGDHITLNFGSVTRDNYLTDPTSVSGKLQDIMLNFYRARNYEDEYCVLGDSVGVNSYDEEQLDSTKCGRKMKKILNSQKDLILS